MTMIQRAGRFSSEAQTTIYSHRISRHCWPIFSGRPTWSLTAFRSGSRQCPGRDFAKYEIMLSFVLIAPMLDNKLLEGTEKDDMRPDMKYYRLGTLPPKGKVPLR